MGKASIRLQHLGFALDDALISYRSDVIRLATSYISLWAKSDGYYMLPNPY